MYPAHVILALLVLLAEGVPNGSPNVALPGLSSEYRDTCSVICMLNARITRIKLHPSSTQALAKPR